MACRPWLRAGGCAGTHERAAQSPQAAGEGRCLGARATELSLRSRRPACPGGWVDVTSLGLCEFFRRKHCGDLGMSSRGFLLGSLGGGRGQTSHPGGGRVTRAVSRGLVPGRQAVGVRGVSQKSPTTEKSAHVPPRSLWPRTPGRANSEKQTSGLAGPQPHSGSRCSRWGGSSSPVGGGDGRAHSHWRAWRPGCGAARFLRGESNDGAHTSPQRPPALGQAP